jgi:hypothetical protein
MSAVDYLWASTALLSSAGIGGAIVWALSSWLGKVWASRILEKDRVRYATELEVLKRHLQSEADTRLAEYQAALGAHREKDILARREKIELYRTAALPVIDLLVALNYRGVRPDDLASFEGERLRVYAHLALFASTDVLEAYDEVVDYVLDTLEGRVEYAWPTVRTLALKTLNRARADVGLTTGEVSYKGRR